MNQTTRNTVLRHLANYKITSLGVEACGEWWKNKKKYQHILPEACRDDNIINKGYRQAIIKMIGVKSRHVGFHHLNSSQALAANLFGPFMAENKMDRLDGLFGLNLVNEKGVFEYIHNIEEGTNFDLAVIREENNLFVEVKYTEGKFGNALPDQRHLDKYEAIYRGRLNAIIKDITMARFLEDYQLWRNISYATIGTVAFVVPIFRADLAKKVEDARKVISVPDKVKLVWIDDICRQGESEKSVTFQSHFAEFRRKYLEIPFE